MSRELASLRAVLLLGKANSYRASGKIPTNEVSNGWTTFYCIYALNIYPSIIYLFTYFASLLEQSSDIEENRGET